MAKEKAPNAKNLIPINKRAKSVQREIQSKGGKARAEKIAERKRVSQIYADVLAAEHNVEFDGEMKKLSGEKLLQEVIARVLARTDAASVSMLKEIREATEGNKLFISGENGAPVQFEFVEPKNASTEKV